MECSDGLACLEVKLTRLGLRPSVFIVKVMGFKITVETPLGGSIRVFPGSLN